MHAPEAKTPPVAVWALGLTQTTGYGTLYYAFSILAPAIGEEFALSQQWVFGAFSAALLAGSLLAPTAGRLADRFGAGRVMTAGSIAASAALAAIAFAPEAMSFVAALVATQLASCFVLYSTAFVAIVQIGPQGAQRSITHITLIAGFASSVFWPLTAWLHTGMSWREVYLVYAAVNLLVCLPIHAWLMRFSRRRNAVEAAQAEGLPAEEHVVTDPRRERRVFLLMLAAFAIEGFVLSAMMVHMVPLLGVLGLGAAGALVATLFGPSQVASRLINMVFGGKLRQTLLAVIASALLTLSLAVLLAGAPALAVVIAAIIMFGLGAGLTSIITGTLPLEMFGRRGYGARLGWMSAARQFSAAFAPFAFAAMMAQMSVGAALSMLIVVGACGAATFVAIAVVGRV